MATKEKCKKDRAALRSTPIEIHFEGPSLVRKDKYRTFESEIPKNFDCKWGISDTVLQIPNGDVVNEIYVNKEFLAVHSPYFKKLFFSDFEENGKDKYSWSINYEVFLNILRLLHRVEPEDGENYMKPLALIYKVADEFDIPVIRAWCNQECLTLDKVEQLLYKDAIGTGNKKKEDYIQMTPQQLSLYLNGCKDDQQFCIAEVIEMLNKTNLRVPRQVDVNPKTKKCTFCDSPIADRETKDRCVSCTETIVTDLTHPWKPSLLEFRTTEPDQTSKVVYCEKCIFCMFSPYLREKLQKSDMTIIKVPFSFDTMQWIIGVIHHSISINDSKFVPTESFLVELCQAADLFDLCFIWKYCVKKIAALPVVDQFKMAYQLGHYKEMSNLLSQNLKTPQLLEVIDTMPDMLWATSDVKNIRDDANSQIEALNNKMKTLEPELMNKTKEYNAAVELARSTLATYRAYPNNSIGHTGATVAQVISSLFPTEIL